MPDIVTNSRGFKLFLNYYGVLIVFFALYLNFLYYLFQCKQRIMNGCFGVIYCIIYVIIFSILFLVLSIFIQIVKICWYFILIFFYFYIFIS